MEEKNSDTEKIQLSPLTELVVLIDKLTNTIFENELEIPASITENRQLNIEIPIEINFLKDSDGNDIPLNQTDKLILTAAISEMAAGNKVLTFSRLFHTMGGNRIAQAPEIKSAIEKSLEILRRTEIKADISVLVAKYKQYAEKINLPPNFKGNLIISGALLPCETITAEINGQIVEGAVKILDTPPLLRIAKLKKQIVRCNPKLLAAPVSATEQNLKLKNYLLERILKIKGSNNPNRNKRVRKLNKTILLESVYRKCELDDSGSNRRAEYRKTISKILDHFKQLGEITDYEFTKRGQKFYSIEISI